MDTHGNGGNLYFAPDALPVPMEYGRCVDAANRSARNKSPIAVIWLKQ